MKPEPEKSWEFLQRLRALGLDEHLATVLEALGPVALLGAQAAYMLEPLIGGRGGVLGEIGRMLEDPEEQSRLAAHLDRGEADT